CARPAWRPTASRVDDRSARASKPYEPAWCLPVIAHARPPTAKPTVAPVSVFQHMHGAPHNGLESPTKPSGIIASAPQRGPRRYHGGGTLVMPTHRPIDMRAT